MILKTLIFIFLSTSLVSANSQTHLQVLCADDRGNYTDDSVYHRNLVTVLSSLTHKALTNSFYNATAGVGLDTIYALYICGGSIDPIDCVTCVLDAADSIQTKCPVEKEAIAVSHQCKLRYANRNIFSQVDINPHSWWCSVGDQVPMNHTEFNAVVETGLGDLIHQVAYNKSSGLFGTREIGVGVGGRLRLEVQCTPDLSSDDCDWCLRSALSFDSSLCGSGMVWNFMTVPSCQLEYRTIVMPKDGGSLLPLPLPLPLPSSSPLMPPLRPHQHYNDDDINVIVKAIVPTVIGLLLLIGVVVWMIKKNKVPALVRSFTVERKSKGGEKYLETTDCVNFDLHTIETATKGFSLSNKLGEGGFGIVYEGVLESGERVAVKRLSQKSGQVSQEFKTEVAVVAKLQHKNLVRLIGFCVKGEERLLIYEFMPNLSLDRFLFEPTRSPSLTWPIRLKIISGISRGLQYLHEDSRVTIVHRDLKTSNILLDEELEPKIADFGMARLVKLDQTSDNTSRVVGTYGYMAPEYVSTGRISVKSDVYSFGVLILEILSGKSNTQFYQLSRGEGLIRRARRIWYEDTVEELMDPVLGNNYSRVEALRCLHIGLLCVQEDESNRPSMNAVLIMLGSNTIELPSPASYDNFVHGKQQPLSSIVVDLVTDVHE